ncbi:MAG: class I SAM-dependent methyltransferase [Desulfomonilaceae bacterium]
MKENCPSETALRVAVRRAAHQVLDDPKVFDDPLALRILSVENASELESSPKWTEETPLSRVLRASLAARSRYAQDELHLAVRRGVHQYVVLGAGLDTFAYRNPYPEGVLHVFEVDHLATQVWKRTRLKEAAIPIPETVTFIPIDFETQTLDDGLRRADFDTSKPTLFSWLGVTPYLTSSAVTATLQFIVSMPVGSGIVFDYMISPSLLNPTARRAFDRLAHGVALAGEPFQTFFAPSSLKSSLLIMGFRQIEDIEPEEMNSRYFQGRTDRLLVGSLAHVMNARV